MRIQLVYAPGCSTYKKALDVLETVIAEERLPIAIEMVEDTKTGKPTVRINGTQLAEPTHTFEGDPCFLGSSPAPGGEPCSEHFRDMISEQWRNLTVPA